MLKKSRLYIVGLVSIIFLLGAFIPSVSAASFKDVKPSNTHYKAIKALSEQRVLQGYPDGNFGVWNSITRQQAAIILSNALKLKTPTNRDALLKPYKDISTNNSARNQIAAVIGHDLMKGSNGKFRPNDRLTREQLATILVRGFKLDKIPAEKVNIYLANTSPSHRANVQVIANHKITVSLKNYQPSKDITRGAFATMLYGAQQVKINYDKKPVSLEQKLEQQAIELTNKERAKQGLKPLKVDSRLTDLARKKSLDMAKKDYFDHTSPTYGSPFDMMDQFGIKYTAAGENIAIGYETAADVVKGWMNSPGHRANILNKDYEYIGIGYEKSNHLWTQHFIKK